MSLKRWLPIYIKETVEIKKKWKWEIGIFKKFAVSPRTKVIYVCVYVDIVRSDMGCMTFAVYDL